MERFCWFNQQYIVLQTNREPGSVWLEMMTIVQHHTITFTSHLPHQQTCSWADLHYNFIIINNPHISPRPRYTLQAGTTVIMANWSVCRDIQSRIPIFIVKITTTTTTTSSVLSISPAWLSRPWVWRAQSRHYTLQYYNCRLSGGVIIQFQCHILFVLLIWELISEKIEVCSCLLLNILSAEDWLVW